jgi:hypothetical protein
MDRQDAKIAKDEIPVNTIHKSFQKINSWRPWRLGG